MRVADEVTGNLRPIAFRKASPTRHFLESRVLTGCLLGIYLLALVWIILLKMQVSLDVVGTIRSVNFIPLAASTVINGVADYREAVMNVLVFVPFGLYLGMLAGGQPLWRELAPIAVTSLAFETLQFVFSMGSSDITDLLANTLGGALGLSLYAFARCACRTSARTLRLCNVVCLVGTALALALFTVLVAVNL